MKLGEMASMFLRYLMLLFLLGLCFCSSGTYGRKLESQPTQSSIQQSSSSSYFSNAITITHLSQRDISTPTTTVPVYYPGGGNPSVTTTTPPYTYPTNNPVPNPSTNPTTPAYSYPANDPVKNPAMNPTTPTFTPGGNTYSTPATAGSSSGQSWCIASQSASQAALQVALDYSCGYGGADCSAIQTGGSCYNPNTIRDHATYAFNEYYQKNPVPTSCDFGGTAVITNIDPSTPTCTYPSTSISSSMLNTTNPTSSGSTVFGSIPPGIGSSGSKPASLPLFASSFFVLASLNALRLQR